MKKLIARGMILTAALSLAGCASGGKEDPIMVLSSAEALTQGRELMDQGNSVRRGRT